MLEQNFAQTQMSKTPQNRLSETKKCFVNHLPEGAFDSALKTPGEGSKINSPAKTLSISDALQFSLSKKPQESPSKYGEETKEDITLTLEDYFHEQASPRTEYPCPTTDRMGEACPRSNFKTIIEPEEECNISGDQLGEFQDTVNEESFYLNFESNRSKINTYNIDPVFKTCKCVSD